MELNLFGQALKITVQDPQRRIPVPGVVGDQNGGSEEVEFRVSGHQCPVVGSVSVGVGPRAQNPLAEHTAITTSSVRDFRPFDTGPVEGMGKLLAPGPMRVDHRLEAESGKRRCMAVTKVSSMVVASVAPVRGGEIKV